MLKKKFAVILIFSLFSFCFFAQENGAEEKTVMTLSEIDSLIARNEYSAALEELSFYIQKYPLQFDKAQKRISKIMKERNAFNQKALELAQKMKQSASEQLNDEQNDNLDSQKMELIVALENAEENPAKEAVDLTNDARRTIRLSYYLFFNYYMVMSCFLSRSLPFEKSAAAAHLAAASRHFVFV